jgi:NAD(P)-dependent dehydrogenase (short-subunit alcohol dehydrogenase family)
MPDPEKLASMSLARCMPLGDALTNLEGKVAIVTGGATGLGFNVANRLCEAGAKVMIASRNQARGDAAVAALAEKGYEAAFCSTDVSSV